MRHALPDRFYTHGKGQSVAERAVVENLRRRAAHARLCFCQALFMLLKQETATARLGQCIHNVHLVLEADTRQFSPARLR